MKKYFKVFAGIAVAALIISGCTPLTYAQGDNGYYNPNYNGDYGDGYGYNQPPADYNNQGNQYSQPGAPVNQPPVGFNDFYNQLSPYGTWLNMPPYGQVWIANVPNFQPYSTNGYWAYTTYGWTWVSNYAWGWAPFHYGRWGFHDRYGWYWVPGYTWGPAWVAWSSSADMYGWAPLMPGMGFNVNLSINLFPASYWTFMPGRYMGSTNIGGYYVNRSRNVTIIKNTTIINNYGTENNRRYSMGPNANDVQRYTGRTIQPMRVSNASSRENIGISNNEMRVYRPVTRSEMTTRTNPGGNNNGNYNNGNNNGNNNRTMNQQQTRPQSNQQQTRPQSGEYQTRPQSGERQTRPQSGEYQTRPQSNEQSGRTMSPQTRQHSGQPETQQTTTPRSSRQNQTPPAVSNRAAPQTTKQIQNAQNDNRRMQQSPGTTSRRR